MRFVVDAQLPPGLVDRLSNRGHSAKHVSRIGLKGASDRGIWQHAANVGAVLVTKDEDFVTLANRDPSGPQVVWVRLGNISNDALWKTLEPLLAGIVAALDAGERIVEVV